MFLVDQPTPRRRILQSAFLIKSAISIDCQLAIGFAAKDAGGRVKRTADILIACTALLLLSPLMLAIAVLVKIDSSGPVFFYQTRLGRNGQNFAILKFRTLVPLNEGIPVASTRDDFRVTRVGKWLRATSTDVLPALVNILLGDMSTVGPSPLAPALAEYLLDKDELALRNSVRPGLTGLAQARGYQEAGDFNLARKRIEADLEYIRGRSFLLDVRIILRTVRAVLFPPKDFQ